MDFDHRKKLLSESIGDPTISKFSLAKTLSLRKKHVESYKEKHSLKKLFTIAEEKTVCAAENSNNNQAEFFSEKLESEFVEKFLDKEFIEKQKLQSLKRLSYSSIFGVEENMKLFPFYFSLAEKIDNEFLKEKIFEFFFDNNLKETTSDYSNLKDNCGLKETERAENSCSNENTILSFKAFIYELLYVFENLSDVKEIFSNEELYCVVLKSLYCLRRISSYKSRDDNFTQFLLSSKLTEKLIKLIADIYVGLKESEEKTGILNDNKINNNDNDDSTQMDCSANNQGNINSNATYSIFFSEENSKNNYESDYKGIHENSLLYYAKPTIIEFTILLNNLISEANISMYQHLNADVRFQESLLAILFSEQNAFLVLSTLKLLINLLWESKSEDKLHLNRLGILGALRHCTEKWASQPKILKQIIICLFYLSSSEGFIENMTKDLDEILSFFFNYFNSELLEETSSFANSLERVKVPNLNRDGIESLIKAFLKFFYTVKDKKTKLFLFFLKTVFNMIKSNETLMLYFFKRNIIQKSMVIIKIPYLLNSFIILLKQAESTGNDIDFGSFAEFNEKNNLNILEKLSLGVNMFEFAFAEEKKEEENQLTENNNNLTHQQLQTDNLKLIISFVVKIFFRQFSFLLTKISGILAEITLHYSSLPAMQAMYQANYFEYLFIAMNLSFLAMPDKCSTALPNANSSLAFQSIPNTQKLLDKYNNFLFRFKLDFLYSLGNIFLDFDYITDILDKDSRILKTLLAYLQNPNYPYNQYLSREIFITLCETSTFLNSFLLKKLLELGFCDYILDNFLNFAEKEFIISIEFLQNVIGNEDKLDCDVFNFFIKKLFYKDFPEIVSNCLSSCRIKDDNLIKLLSNLEFSIFALEKCYRKWNGSEKEQKVSNFSENTKGWESNNLNVAAPELTMHKLRNIENNLNDFSKPDLNGNGHRLSSNSALDCSFPLNKYNNFASKNRNEENHSENISSNKVNLEDMVSKYQKSKSEFKQAIRPKFFFEGESNNNFVKSQFSDQKRLQFEEE